MERRFEGDLRELKRKILEMGGLVELALETATLAIKNHDPQKLNDIRQIEKKINQAHLAIDEACLEVLARQAPLAADLRLILAIVKINSDLERMGDQAVNVSYNCEHFFTDHTLEIAKFIPEMTEKVKVMIKNSLDAFTRGDVVLANQVMASDDEVDDLKNKVFKATIPFMHQNPSKIESSLDLILIARNLERMADHATNIAEDVIFATTGKDVRHGKAIES